MRIPRTLRAGVLIAAAVILGLLTVQGTYALWSASANAAPGTVSSASFDVILTASPSEQVSNMTLAGGPATISLTQTASLSPGTSVYASLAVSNNTNAGGQFNTAITAGELTKAYTGSGTIANYLTFTGKNVATRRRMQQCCRLRPAHRCRDDLGGRAQVDQHRVLFPSKPQLHRPRFRERPSREHQPPDHRSSALRGAQWLLIFRSQEAGGGVPRKRAPVTIPSGQWGSGHPAAVPGPRPDGS